MRSETVKLKALSAALLKLPLTLQIMERTLKYKIKDIKIEFHITAKVSLDLGLHIIIYLLYYK